MIFIYGLLIILSLLFTHLFILPFSKKRPIFVKGFEGSFFIFILLILIATFVHPILYLIAIGIGILIFYTKSWVVFGVSLENINTALDKAILATRASSNNIANGREIDNNMIVKFTYLGMKFCLIRYKSKVHSKKSELTKEVFRKFLQNNFI